MKLYYSPGTCALVVRIIMNELNLDSEFESVDLKTKKTQNGKDFYSVNPKGVVPALDLGTGEILTENSVILQYLADSNKAWQLLPEVNNLNRYRVLEWLNFISSDLHKTFYPLFSPKVTQDLKDFFVPLIKDKFKYLNQKLETSPYLHGDAFTLPDAYLFVVIRWTFYLKIDISELTAITAYFEKLSKRPSIIKSLKEDV